jgi:hypothetical protein
MRPEVRHRFGEALLVPNARNHEPLLPLNDPTRDSVLDVALRGHDAAVIAIAEIAIQGVLVAVVDHQA